jgi:hypothetical protein
METTPELPDFLDRLGADLGRAYTAHASRRRRRRVATLAPLVALTLVATAAGVSTLIDGFGIDQNKQADITGTPPALIACGAAECARSDSTSQLPDAAWRYEFSHTLGTDLPSSGALAESEPGQGVFDSKGNELDPPAGANLAYACTAIHADSLNCEPLVKAGPSLPRGTAIYILSPSEYHPAAP